MNHFEKSKSSKLMETRLAKILSELTLENRIKFKYMVTDRDNASWKAMAPAFKQLSILFGKSVDELWEIYRKLCMGHDMVNYEKELNKQVLGTSKMLQKNLCAANLGGTCGHAVISGGKEGKKRKCERGTVETSKALKRAMSYAVHDAVTPDNCATSEQMAALDGTIAKACKQKLEHFTEYDREKHPELKGKRITCTMAIVAATMATNKFVVTRTKDHVLPEYGVCTTGRLECLWAQIAKVSPKQESLAAIESINTFHREICKQSELPICKLAGSGKKGRKMRAAYPEPALIRIARAYEQALKLEPGALLPAVGAAREVLHRNGRVANSRRRSSPEYRHKATLARREKEKKRVEAKAKAGDKGYKSKAAVAGNWEGTDLPASQAPALKEPSAKVCVDCGRKGHLSGRATKQCTAEGTAQWQARKDATKAEGEEAAELKGKVKKITSKGEEVVDWIDVWDLTNKIALQMRKDPTVYHAPDEHAGDSSDSGSEDD